MNPLNENIKTYQDLYLKYKELLTKTSIKSYKVSAGKVTVQDILPVDLEEKNEVEKRLLEGLDFLSDNQLIDLAGDEPFSVKASAVLIKRKEVQ